MSKLWRYWTKENCYEEAKKYKSRDEFYKKSPGAYSSARIHNWLNEYTWFKPLKRWTYDEVRSEALKYKSKKEFNENNHKAYNASKKHKWIENFTWLVDDRLNLYIDKVDSVYAYEFIEQHAVYVGRTLMRNQTKRDRDHLFSNDSVSSFAKSNNISIPSMKILEDNLTLKEGVDKEEYWVEKYKLNGWIILNRIKTGSIGSLGKGKWNYNSCYEEAKKYKNRKEFQKKAGRAYRVAKKNGWIEDYSWFIIGRQIKWSFDIVKSEALKYKSTSEFRKGNKLAFDAAYRNNWLKNFDWLSYKISSKDKRWTYENTRAIAMKCKSRTEFHRICDGAYRASLTYGWIDEFFPNK